MRINENTDVNAFYLFPTRYGLKLASNIRSFTGIIDRSNNYENMKAPSRLQKEEN